MTTSQPPSRSRAWLALDLLGVLVFALAGRRSHMGTLDLAGILAVAWPFAAGAVVGWLATKAWRSPAAVLPTGVVVWLCTLVVGMLLRAVTGQGTAWPFVVVATLVLAALLVGWRLVVRWSRVVRGRRTAPAGASR